jgi:hypothetical protein
MLPGKYKIAAKSKMALNTYKIVFLLPNGQFSTNFPKKIVRLIIASTNSRSVCQKIIQDGAAKRYYFKMAVISSV